MPYRGRLEGLEVVLGGTRTDSQHNIADSVMMYLPADSTLHLKGICHKLWEACNIRSGRKDALEQRAYNTWCVRKDVLEHLLFLQ